MQWRWLAVAITLSSLTCTSDPESLSGGPNTPRSVGDDSITVMSYNILHGGGIDPKYDEISTRFGFPGNRIPKILQLIRSVNPDVLGLQEALSWEKGTPPFAQQFADSLGGFSYFLAVSRGIHHVAVFSKLKIVQAENFREDFSRAALRVTLENQAGDHLRLIVAHLHPADPDKANESARLLRRANEIAGQKSIVMGDFNQHSETGTLTRALVSNGWSLTAKDAQVGIDQIWSSSSLSGQTRQLNLLSDVEISRQLLETASDHWPVTAEIAVK